MNMQPLIFILLFGGIQGVLLLLFFIHKKLYSSAYIFLLIYIGTILLQLTVKVMSKTWLMGNWPIFYYSSHWQPLLYGPLIYLFVKHLIKPQPLKLKETVHFLPVAVSLAIIFFDAAGLFIGNIATIFFHPNFRLAVLLASVISYHTVAFKMVKRYSLNMKSYFSDTLFLQLKWIKQLVIVSGFTSLVIVAALYLLYIWYPFGHEFRYGFVALSICIYWFSYTALTKPFVFSVIKGNAKEDSEKEFSIPQLKVYKPGIKYANSTLTGEEAMQIAASMEKLMEKEKLYLQPELTISQLADLLQSNRHHLSQVLNEKLGKSYYDYINCLRIEEAKRLLNDSKYLQHKIASIAYDCGFNSLSTFNDVFKKHTGKTPSEYRKETLKESRQERV